MDTIHYMRDRAERQKIVEYIGHGETVLKVANIDRGHPNGTERHEITDTGLIFIYNERTEKLVTVLIARPQQIKRYYYMVNKPVPTRLLNLAFEHTRLGYNEI